MLPRTPAAPHPSSPRFRGETKVGTGPTPLTWRDFRANCAPLMSNRAIWNVRKRHEWLATPLKSRRIKRAQRLRCGLQDAIDRKATTEPQTEG